MWTRIHQLFIQLDDIDLLFGYFHSEKSKKRREDQMFSLETSNVRDGLFDRVIGIVID